jgi:tRNA nucleotidyltransferase/poly(A) polymerase
MTLRSAELARRVCAVLREAGHAAYLAGGAVRDRLLGRPVLDYDIATSAPPERVLTLFPAAQEIGAHFGVILVKDEAGEVHVATFRSDHSYQDGRRPEAVSYETEPEKDVQRRDFTINGLLEDPSTGEVLDFVGGRADLEARLIRAIGDPDRRFHEDRLRLLRGVRFAARLGFEIERDTLDAMRRNAALIGAVSAERIRDEISRILTEGGARRGFELLDSTGLLHEVLPEVERMKGVPQPPEFHREGDVWVHTLLLLENLPAGGSITLALAALLHDVAKPDTLTVSDRIRFNGHAELGAARTREILARLRYPSSVIEDVEALVRQHMRFLDVPGMGQSAFKRLLRIPQFEELLELHRLDTLACLAPLTTYEEVRERRAALSERDLRPEPLLRGGDLIDLGYTPGPAFRTMLEALEDAQLEGRIRSREDAIALLQARFARG